jgi:hypothetical protein
MTLFDLPDLTFPDVQQGKNETPLDLRFLLFKGGADIRRNLVTSCIESGALGPPATERIDLVEKLHEEMNATLKGGGSTHTLRGQYTDLRGFFRWADASGLPLNLESIETTYLHWADHLLHRIRIVKNIGQVSAYNRARDVGSIVDKALERISPIVCNTRLALKKKRKRTLGVQADKQNLADTFDFGHALLDIVDATPLEAIWGPLPLRIRLRTGRELVEWSGLIPPEKLKTTNPQTPQQRYYSKISSRIRADYANDRTLRSRWRLVNLRIEAELLLFIGQTGMNLAQAHQLRARKFRYISCIDGYEVRDYKDRRQGEVLFEIFRDYRKDFERYLAWREAIFPGDPQGLLFPLVKTGERADDMPPKFGRVKGSCDQLGLRFIGPGQLRKTRINWFLRRSRDPDLTSEQAQHSKETLLTTYEEPSLQVAMVEITRFWQGRDPALPSTAPGVCNGVPVPEVDIPPEAPQPDCIRPSGCLWCVHHRDIDSQDYVWSLASMRHLKIFVLKGFRPPEKGKTNESALHVELVIERLTTKLRWFRQSNELRCSWVEEALARIDEASYHPHWHYIIVAVEED